MINVPFVQKLLLAKMDTMTTTVDDSNRFITADCALFSTGWVDISGWTVNIYASEPLYAEQNYNMFYYLIIGWHKIPMR